jgi:hypothetical protein
MIVFPLIRLALICVVGLKAAAASSRVETLPMFVRSRPSRTESGKIAAAQRTGVEGHDESHRRPCAL